MYKNKGIIYAEAVASWLGNWEVDGWIETFNNCREQGYILRLENNTVTVYVYAHRNTDKLTISWDEGYGDRMYSEDAYYNRTISFDTVEQAVDKIMKIIEDIKSN